jgi:hypothetical protein
MKKVLAALFITALSAATLAQTKPQPVAGAKPQEESVSERPVADLTLSQRSFRPKLTMQRALQLAESHLKREKIDLSPFYLYEAKYILYGSKDDQEPCWFFWWLNENGALGNYVQLVVSIETGNVRLLPSM